MNTPSAPYRPSTFPKLGVACVCGGLLLAWAYFRFPNYIERLDLAARSVFALLALGLIAFGVLQIIAVFQPEHERKKSDRLQRRPMIISQEGLAYLLIMCVLLVGSLLGRENMLMLVFGMMAGPFVLNGWATHTMLHSCLVERRVPRRSMAGQPFSVELELKNQGRFWSAWVMAIRDVWRSDREELTAGVLFARVPARDSRIGHYQVQLARRGRYQVGPLQLICRFPLGLIERRRAFETRQEVLVYPRIGTLHSQWRRQLMIASDLVQRSKSAQGMYHDEFHHLREYRAGDNPRDIHWRASARRQELIVRQFHQNRDRQLAIVCDLFLPPKADAAAADRVELALSFLATICLRYLEFKRDSALEVQLVGDDVQSWIGSAAPTSLEELFDQLAVARAGNGDLLNQTINDLLLRSGADVQVILITTRSLTGADAGDSPHTLNLGDAAGRVSVFVAEPEALSSIFSPQPVA